MTANLDIIIQTQNDIHSAYLFIVKAQQEHRLGNESDEARLSLSRAQGRLDALKMEEIRNAVH